MDDAQIRTLRSHEEMVVRVLDAVSNCSIHDRGRVLRRLSMQYHPDKPTGSTVLFQMFSSLTSLSIPDLYYKQWELNSKIHNLIMAPTRAAFENRQSLVDGAFVYGMPENVSNVEADTSPVVDSIADIADIAVPAVDSIADIADIVAQPVQSVESDAEPFIEITVEAAVDPIVHTADNNDNAVGTVDATVSVTSGTSTLDRKKRCSNNRYSKNRSSSKDVKVGTRHTSDINTKLPWFTLIRAHSASHVLLSNTGYAAKLRALASGTVRVLGEEIRVGKPMHIDTLEKRQVKAWKIEIESAIKAPDRKRKYHKSGEMKTVLNHLLRVAT